MLSWEEILNNGNIDDFGGCLMKLGIIKKKLIKILLTTKLTRYVEAKKHVEVENYLEQVVADF